MVPVGQLCKARPDWVRAFFVARPRCLVAWRCMWRCVVALAFVAQTLFLLVSVARFMRLSMKPSEERESSAATGWRTRGSVRSGRPASVVAPSPAPGVATWSSLMTFGISDMMTRTAPCTTGLSAPVATVQQVESERLDADFNTDFQSLSLSFNTPTNRSANAL